LKTFQEQVQADVVNHTYIQHIRAYIVNAIVIDYAQSHLLTLCVFVIIIVFYMCVQAAEVTEDRLRDVLSILETDGVVRVTKLGKSQDKITVL
jgi:hypothetical protein